MEIIPIFWSRDVKRDARHPMFMVRFAPLSASHFPKRKMKKWDFFYPRL
jgi:hypothetical protein